MTTTRSLSASLFFVSSLTFAMRFELPQPVEKNTIQLTKIGAISCGVLGLYKLAQGSLNLVTFRPIRAVRNMGWGAISLCAAVALYQWSQEWERNNQFKMMSKN